MRQECEQDAVFVRMCVVELCVMKCNWIFEIQIWFFATNKNQREMNGNYASGLM